MQVEAGRPSAPGASWKVWRYQPPSGCGCRSSRRMISLAPRSPAMPRSTHAHPLKLSLAARISPKAWAGRPDAGAASGARKNGLVAFSADGGRHGRLAAFAGGEHRFRPRLQRRIVVDRQGEAGVRGGVFVGAVDGGVVGQGGQLGQRAPHLFGRALEQSAAAEGEQGVADEGDVVGCVVIGDVAQGVAAGVDHLNRVSPSITCRPPRRRSSGAMRVTSGRADDGRAGRRLEGLVAAGVVRMPVGVEDQVQFPAQFVELGQDGVGVRRVDGRGFRWRRRARESRNCPTGRGTGERSATSACSTPPQGVTRVRPPT
jgi:hypothetical protein